MGPTTCIERAVYQPGRSQTSPVNVNVASNGSGGSNKVKEKHSEGAWERRTGMTLRSYHQERLTPFNGLEKPLGGLAS